MDRLNTSEPVRQALILAGGRGTRLGSITDDCPKPLLPVAGRPFLVYLLGRLPSFGVTEVILSIGYRAQDFASVIPEGRRGNLRIRHQIETVPAGTGGAVRLALPHLADRAYVLNGDTLFDINLGQLGELLANTADAAASVALRRVPDTSRFGRVTLDAGKVTGFAEKSAAGPGLINGGIYCLRRDTVSELPTGPSSLERDLFPPLANAGRLVGAEMDGYFIDIGLPETLALAQSELPAWERRHAAHAKRD